MSTAYTIVFKETARKDIQKLPPLLQRRIAKKLAYYISQPNPLENAVALRNPARGGSYRFRVGNYRVVFDIEGVTLVVIYVEHRSGVYKKR